MGGFRPLRQLSTFWASSLEMLFATDFGESYCCGVGNWVALTEILPGVLQSVRTCYGIAFEAYLAVVLYYQIDRNMDDTNKGREKPVYYASSTFRTRVYSWGG